LYRCLPSLTLTLKPPHKRLMLDLACPREEMTMMNKELMTAKILEAKVAKGMTWEASAESIGMSPVFTTSACLGMNSLAEDKAFALCETLGLDKPIAEALQVCPKKTWEGGVPQDPLIYRLYEVVGVYGDTMKALIHEKSGDG